PALGGPLQQARGPGHPAGRLDVVGHPPVHREPHRPERLAPDAGPAPRPGPPGLTRRTWRLPFSGGATSPFSAGLVLGLVHRAVGVLGRAVHRVEDERAGAGVDEVVPGAGRDGDQVARPHRADLAADAGLAGAGDEVEELVGALVHLVADLTALGDGHG